MKGRFWIPQHNSGIKKALKGCVHCRRFNNRVDKLNQAPYPDLRSDPPKIHFRAGFIDHMGPLYVDLFGTKMKLWLLCITCRWSRPRAIN